jgi:4-hydroxybenzoate polyprenyltransferase
MLDTIVNWLRVFRAQTAAAVFMLVLIPYLTAGGPLYSWNTLILALWSILAHHMAFGHNTVMDTLMGWDIMDQNKLHHPLVANFIKKETALKVISIGIFFSTLIAIFLVGYSDGNRFYAMAFLSLFLIGGMIYNSGISKISIWDVVPISICFTSLSLFSYFLVAKEFNELIILIALYIILLQWFEIGVEGEIKEIELKNEINLLTKLGTKFDGNSFDMGKSIIYPWGLKLAGLTVGGYIVYKYTYEITTIVLFALFAFLAIYFCYQLTKKRIWSRKKALRDMALEEIVTIFLLPVILIPIIGVSEVMIILAFAIMYFIGMNSLLWKTRFAPRV